MIASLLRLAGTACWGVKEYVDCFGFFRGLALLLVALLWPQAKERKVRVAIPGRSVSVLVRPGSTDISVFNTTYRSEQYNYEFTKPPHVIVDAGAYTGLSTVYFATRYPEASIIAIEPDGANYDLLLQNTSGLANVHPVRAALWSNKGLVELADPGKGAWAFRVTEIGDSSNVKVHSGKDGGRQIPAITVSGLINEYGLSYIDLLKLDIEGSEKEVLAGSAPWIARVGAICIELHDRFKPGCSREFYRVADVFPTELRRGETIMVTRD
jgi:FkbM family methyltransferase